jgi:hypothetical protein
MALFGSKSHSGEISLVVDIGNGSITGAFVAFGKGNSPVFLYTAKRSFELVEKIDTTKLFEGMNTLLDEILKEMMENGFKNSAWKGRKKAPDNAMVTFSSPWFTLKTKHVGVSKENFFIVTEAFIDDIIKKEQEIFVKEISGVNSEEQTGNFRVIEKSIVHTKVNGYPMRDAIGKKTRIFDAFLCMSLVSENVVNRTHDIILEHTHIPKERVLLHTFPLVAFSTVRDIFSNNSSFILMDVTGEGTDLTLVQDDVISESLTFESGRNYILRKIAKEFDVPMEVAESTLHLFLEKKINDSDYTKIEEIITEIEKEWSVYFENALLQLSPSMAIPPNVYMTAENDVAAIYSTFMKLSKSDATSSFRNNVSLTHINSETLSNLFVKDPLIIVNEFVAMSAIFYNKLFQK